MKTKKLISILVAGSLTLFILSYFQDLFWHYNELYNEPLHSAIEAFGALASILMGIILLQRQRLKIHYELLWMILGLLVMGVLDGFHAAIAPGNNFVLLHSSSVFFGGLFFSFMWFLENKKTAVFRGSILWSAVLSFVLLSIWTLLSPKTMPLMMHNEEFTPTATFLNVFGGILFLVGAVFFIKKFYQTQEKEFYWFGAFSVLLGLGGITFIEGGIWTSDWWLWHVLRFAAFMIVLSIVIRDYQQSASNLYFALTKHKQSEEALKISEGKYYNLVEFANAGIIAGESGKIVEVNKKAEEIYGYSKDELIGQSLNILTPEKYRKKHQEILNEILKTGKGKEMIFEEEGIRKDGTLFPIEISFSLTKPGEKTIIAVMRDITERKRAEEEIKEKENHLNNIIESSLDGIVVGDSRGNIVKANRSFLKLTGYSEKGITEKHIMELSITEKGTYKSTTGESVEIDEEFFKDAKAMTYDRLFKEGEITNWVTYYLRKDKKIVPVEQNISYLYDEEGDIIGSVGITRDITERKKAEKEIIEAKEFLENLIKTSSDAIVVTDPQGNITMVNDALEVIAGYSKDELLGKHVTTLRPPGEEARNNIDIQHENFFKNGVLRRDVNIWQRKDGQHIFVESNLSILRDKNGETVGAVGFNRDITERIKFEEALKISEEKYRSVVENANDAIYSTNEEGIVLSFNKKAEEIIGYSYDEIVGKSFLITLPPDQREKHQKWLEKYGVTKSFLTQEPLEVKVLKKNGQEIFTEITYSMIEVGGTKIIYCIVRDITERKKMEQQLLQSEKLKSLGELSGGVAHDFNNILAAILGRSQLLKYAFDAPPGKKERRKAMEEMRGGLEIIERAALDGAETVRRIQEFSRRREDDKNLTTIDLNEVIDHALEFTSVKWKNEAESKGIQIIIQKELSPLPPTVGSASELREVFTNLINNAIDAMPQGGRIKIKTFRDNSHIAIKVEDTGIGIPKGVKDKIFDPFFTTKGVQSTGLGLSVTYGIINRHRGTISVDSVEDQGTTFTIKLPFTKRNAKEEKVQEVMSVEQRKGKILVIEDEADVRELLSDILSNGSHEVDTASDGNQGIALFKKKEYDLVFTDLGMPGMSGWQVTEEIKKINRKIPIVLITGWEVKLNESEMRESGVDLVVNKPFVVDQVLKLAQEGMQLKNI